MMCGHIFDEGEQAVSSDMHGFHFGLAEEMMACPVCSGTDISRTVRCKKCYGEYTQEEMLGPYCRKCVVDSIDCYSFREFATTGTKNHEEIDVMEDFIFTMIFHVPTPERSSYELKQALLSMYDSRMLSERLIRSTELLDMVQDYFSAGNELDDYAWWLEQKEEHDNVHQSISCRCSCDGDCRNAGFNRNCDCGKQKE